MSIITTTHDSRPSSPSSKHRPPRPPFGSLGHRLGSSFDEPIINFPAFTKDDFSFSATRAQTKEDSTYISSEPHLGPFLLLRTSPTQMNSVHPGIQRQTFKLRGHSLPRLNAPVDLFCPRFDSYPSFFDRDYVNCSLQYIRQAPCIDHFDICTIWKGLTFAQATELFYWENTFVRVLESMIRDQVLWLKNENRLRYGGDSGSCDPASANASRQVRVDTTDLVMNMVNHQHNHARQHDWFASSNNKYAMVAKFVRIHDCFLDASPLTGNVGDAWLDVRLGRESTWFEDGDFNTYSDLELGWFPKFMKFSDFNHFPKESQEYVLIPRMAGLNKSDDISISYITDASWLCWDEGIKGFRGNIPRLSENGDTLTSNLIRPSLDDKTNTHVLRIGVSAIVTEDFGSAVHLEKRFTTRVSLRVQPGEGSPEDRLKGIYSMQSTRKTSVVEKNKLAPLPGNENNVHFVCAPSVGHSSENKGKEKGEVIQPTFIATLPFRKRKVASSFDREHDFGTENNSLHQQLPIFEERKTLKRRNRQGSASFHCVSRTRPQLATPPRRRRSACSHSASAMDIDVVPDTSNGMPIYREYVQAPSRPKEDDTCDANDRRMRMVSNHSLMDCETIDPDIEMLDNRRPNGSLSSDDDVMNFNAARQANNMHPPWTEPVKMWQHDVSQPRAPPGLITPASCQPSASPSRAPSLTLPDPMPINIFASLNRSMDSEDADIGDISRAMAATLEIRETLLEIPDDPNKDPALLREERKALLAHKRRMARQTSLSNDIYFGTPSVSENDDVNNICGSEGDSLTLAPQENMAGKKTEVNESEKQVGLSEEAPKPKGYGDIGCKPHDPPVGEEEVRKMSIPLLLVENERSRTASDASDVTTATDHSVEIITEKPDDGMSVSQFQQAMQDKEKRLRDMREQQATRRDALHGQAVASSTVGSQEGQNQSSADVSMVYKDREYAWSRKRGRIESYEYGLPCDHDEENCHDENCGDDDDDKKGGHDGDGLV